MAHARPDPSFPALLRRKKGQRSAGCPGRPALLARAHSPLSRRSAVAGSLGSGGGADPDHSLAWPRAGDRLTRGRTPCTLAQRSGRRRRAAPGTRSPGTLAAAEQRDARVPSSAGDHPRIFGPRPFALASPDSGKPSTTAASVDSEERARCSTAVPDEWLPTAPQAAGADALTTCTPGGGAGPTLGTHVRTGQGRPAPVAD